MSGPPEGYVDVAARIRAFYERFPEGRLRRQGDPEVTDIDGKHFVVYTALAYRDADDKLPGMGTAWEPFPGPTPFTRDSELMNAETAAWGRAIASLGFEVHQGIATAEDVRNRSGETPKVKEVSGPSEKQLDFIASLAKKLGADQADQDLLRDYASKEFTKAEGGGAITALKGEADMDAADALVKFLAKANKWAEGQTDLPADAVDLPEAA